MAYEYDRDLQLSYDPSRGYFHFVLYGEPPGGWGSGINAAHIVGQSESRYAAEWLNRLQSCAPDALHVALVGSQDARKLWDPCVYDDPDSPSAVAGDGCVCLRPLQDPLTWLPVAADHYRTVSGNIEHWRYHTFTPVSLPEGDRLNKLIIDREADTFWVRTESADLMLLPQTQGSGYNVGYGGGGPAELARMIVKIVESAGEDVSAGTDRRASNRKVASWVSSRAADRTQELTLQQLDLLCRTGMVT